MKDRNLIVMFCRCLGGHGGVEINFSCLINSLPQYRYKIFVQYEIRNYGIQPIERGNVTVEYYHPKHFLKYMKRNEKDILLFLRSSPEPFKDDEKVLSIIGKYSFLKAIIPSGNNVNRVEPYYDAVLWQANNSSVYEMPHNHPKAWVLPPPAASLDPDNSSFIRIQPEPFLLTTFNYYGEHLKGSDTLRKSVDRLPLPLVWCHNGLAPIDFQSPNLFPVTVDRTVLYSLLETCSAYISFSHKEGFGWSIFEAMLMKKPIVSRRIGVLTLSDSDAFYYHDHHDLIPQIEAAIRQQEAKYDLSVLSKDHFVYHFNKLINWYYGNDSS